MQGSNPPWDLDLSRSRTSNWRRHQAPLKFLFSKGHFWKGWQKDLIYFFAQSFDQILRHVCYNKDQVQRNKGGFHKWSVVLQRAFTVYTASHVIFIYLFIYLFIFLMFIYFWDRERQSMNGGGSERGRHRIWNGLQALSGQHRARRGLELTDREIMTWAEVGRLTNWATQAPRVVLFLIFCVPFCLPR